MKKVQCSYSKCSSRRSHHESLRMTRPHRMIDVPDDYEGEVFCSIECKLYYEEDLKSKKEFNHS